MKEGARSRGIAAKKYRMKPRAFGRYWHDVLRMHKENFLASKYADLVSLIVAQP